MYVLLASGAIVIIALYLHLTIETSVNFKAEPVFKCSFYGQWQMKSRFYKT